MSTDPKNLNRRCNALVVEGGAMRGIFSTGILDAFLSEAFNPFDICIGVSAGATNIAAYLAEMPKRNFKVYTDYSVRPDFISLRKFIAGSHLVDLDWIWSITIRELRLDLDTIFSSGRDFFVGVTEASTGKAVYLKPDKGNLEEIIKASSSLPVFYRKFVQIDGIEYTDGGLADPIPVIEAYRRGARNIMVLRSRPFSFVMKPGINNILGRFYMRKYPRLVDAMMDRSRVYREAIDFMRKPPEGVKILEVNPPESFRTKRLTKDVSILKQDYANAYEMGRVVMEKWRALAGTH